MKTIIKVESVNKTYEIPYKHTLFPSFKDAVSTAETFIKENIHYNLLGVKRITCTICSEANNVLVPKYVVYNSGEEIIVEKI